MKCLVIVLALLAWASASAVDKPNIIFIFSDDHAQHAISAYGSKVNHTPHIDRLAKEGARFTRSFCINSICTPSRATLLTGQYSHANGVPVFNRFDGSSMDCGGTTPLFLRPSLVPPTVAFTIGTPAATPPRAGKAETRLRTP